MNAGQIIEEATSKLPSGYFSDVITTSWALARLSLIQDRIVRLYDFSWARREIIGWTVNLLERYELPSEATEQDDGSIIWAVRKVISLELVDADCKRYSLIKGDKAVLDNSALADTGCTRGRPTHYAIDVNGTKSYLWLYPMPDHSCNGKHPYALDLEYYGFLPPLEETSDESWLTIRHPDLLEAYLLAECKKVGEEFDQAQYWQGIADAKLTELIAEDVGSTLGTDEIGLQPLEENIIGM